MKHKILNDLTLIKPKIKGESDKYSWNFFKHLNKIKDKEIKIYYHTRSYISGEPITFNENEFLIGNVIVVRGVIKSNGGLIGCALSNVLRGGKIEDYWYSNIHNDFYEITDEFFNLYLEKGRCLFDANHNGWLAHDDDRFTTYDKYRICNYCGKRQNKKVEKVCEEVTNWI
ncbi:hypothetical protein [Lysinibacillus sp. BPa_S21]|uniref:hypothetical protein n=1 Tax=Lysinibacillus sp. BPa_S21 TaxID=2932478 RepID=UPI0020123769|nr:hypothetical protein [Lysinibacillus sp. BPa_S21]MCL1696337.1 hypothetical protein [Lysinibacillus sp. BPa_S21]